MKVKNAEQPKMKPFQSHRSLFVLYDKCPYLYYLTYEKRKKAPFVLYQNLYLTSGYIFHDIMETHWKEHKGDWTKTMNLAMSVTEINKKISKDSKRVGGFFPVWAKEEMRSRVIGALEQVKRSEHIELITKGARKIIAEPLIERTFKGFNIQVRIDLLVQDQDGSWTMLDYKVSKRKSGDDGTQLIFYSTLVPVQRAFFYFVMDDVLVPVDVSKEKRKQMLRRMFSLLNRIHSGDRKADRRYCGRCFLNEVCAEQTYDLRLLT